MDKNVIILSPETDLSAMESPHREIAELTLKFVNFLKTEIASLSDAIGKEGKTDSPTLKAIEHAINAIGLGTANMLAQGLPALLNDRAAFQFIACFSAHYQSIKHVAGAMGEQDESLPKPTSRPGSA